jgi:hypothetical protein
LVKHNGGNEGDFIIRGRNRDMLVNNASEQEKKKPELQETNLDRYGMAFSYMVENVYIYNLCWRDVKEGDTIILP